MTQKLYLTAFMATVEKNHNIRALRNMVLENVKRLVEAWSPHNSIFIVFSIRCDFFLSFALTRKRRRMCVVYWSYRSSLSEYIQNRIWRLSIKPFLLSILSGNAYSSINLLPKNWTSSFNIVLNVCVRAEEPMCVIYKLCLLIVNPELNRKENLAFTTSKGEIVLYLTCWAKGAAFKSSQFLDLFAQNNQGFR